MINVGIDVHKKRCQACLKDEKGKLIEELSIPNGTQGAEQVARPLERKINRLQRTVDSSLQAE
jgi:hypothetical protein